MKRLIVVFIFGFIFILNLMAQPTDILGKWRLGNLEIVFNTDKTYVWKDSHGTISGKFKVNGTFLTMYYKGKGSQYLFLIKGNTLRLTDAAGNVIKLQKETEKKGNKKQGENIFGVWSAGSIKLVLEKSGKYRFGPSSGTFEVVNGRIIMHDKSGKTANYDYLLRGDTLKIRDFRGNVLTLKREKTIHGQSNSDTSKTLIGKWYFKNNYRLMVAFFDDGTYLFATDKGRYNADSNHIYFKSMSGRNSTYTYEISGNVLYLTDPNGNTMEFIRGK